MRFDGSMLELWPRYRLGISEVAEAAIAMVVPSTLVRGAEFMAGAVGSLMKPYQNSCGISLVDTGDV
jgi:hypothetical protein